MPLEKDIKASPAYWIAGFVAAVVGGTLGFEARYAKAGDVAAARAELKEEIMRQRSYTDAGFARQRKAALEDKVFELEAKRQARRITEIELRQLLRYRAELDDVNRELRGKLR